MGSRYAYTERGVTAYRYASEKIDFIKVTLFSREILTDDWTDLIIDEEVFKNPLSEDHHVTYRLSVVKSE